MPPNCAENEPAVQEVAPSAVSGNSGFKSVYGPAILTEDFRVFQAAAGMVVCLQHSVSFICSRSLWWNKERFVGRPRPSVRVGPSISE